MRRTLLVTSMLLIALLSSIIGVASAGGSLGLNYSKQTTAMLKIKAQDNDCQHLGDTTEFERWSLAIKQALAEQDNDAGVAYQCCSSITILTFPATMPTAPDLARISTLALINIEQGVKACSLSESIYKPPIV